MNSKVCLTCSALIVSIFSLAAQPVLFDFENSSAHSPLPLYLTVDGITAHFSGTGQGFSIQSANTMGFTPAGFSGNCIYPSSVFQADLLISFSQSLSDLSILYAPQELACDTSARMRVTAFMESTLIATATTTADPPGTWPTATLAISAAEPFNNVVIHYDAPPPTGGDWGPIFMADNLSVTAIPEPQSLLLLMLSIAGAVYVRRRHFRGKPSIARR